MPSRFRHAPGRPARPPRDRRVLPQRPLPSSCPSSMFCHWIDRGGKRFPAKWPEPLYPGERSVERKRRPGAARHGIVTHPSGRLMCNKGRKGPTMLIRNSRGIPSSEITPKHVYLTRRTLLAGAAGLLGAGTVTGDAAAEPLSASPSPFSTDEKRTSLKDVTSYNI